MDKELITKARQANLPEYLLSIGEPLKREGSKYYRHQHHKTLVFTENAFSWNDRKGEGKGRESGNAIDYLMNHMGMKFIDAVSALTNGFVSSKTAGKEKNIKERPVTTFSLDSLVISTDQKKARQYLDRERYIGHEIINYLIQNKLLLQEERTNNALFLMYDERSVCVGAEMQGTTKKRFKGLKSGSKWGYGFNIRYSDDNTFDYALFFESAVDLISFIDYVKYHGGKTLDRCILVSMSGLKPNIVKHSLKAFKGNPKAVICIDNDDAAQLFLDKLTDMDISYSLRLPDAEYKDWNEQLQKSKRDYTPIGRLINRAEDNFSL